MLMLFTCEQCGKRIKVDARMQGRKGRCSNCGREMRIPRADETHPPPLPTAKPAHVAGPGPVAEPAHAERPTHAVAADAPFRLSPPEQRPEVATTYFHQPPVLTEPEHLHRHIGEEAPSEFELLADGGGPEDQALASPEVQRGLRELEEFKEDPRPYQLAEELDSRFFRWARGSGPAGWIYTQWRKGVSLILRVLRFIDDWAYLISVPFLILMVFGIATAQRGLIHTGAVVVVLANFGRFWTDLLALFVRPFKEGPVHGVLFFFPPYTVYFVGKHWDKFKPTFRRLVTSCIPIVLVLLAYAFIPSIDPDIQSARTVPEKLRRAEREIVKEAREGLHEAGEKLHEAGEKLRSLEKTALPKPKSGP
jgi:hypothetical protein